MAAAVTSPHGLPPTAIVASTCPDKRGLMVANGVGIVDADYCGPTDEVKIEVFNFTQQPVRHRPRRPTGTRAVHPGGAGALGGIDRGLAREFARRLRRHGLSVTIYIAWTVRGDRGAVSALRTLCYRLEAEGHHILTKHLLDDGVDLAEGTLTERAVYDSGISTG